MTRKSRNFANFSSNDLTKKNGIQATGLTRRTAMYLVFAVGMLSCQMDDAFAASSDAGSAEVRQLLMATFDKPDSRLTVDPVVVSGDIAIAGWTQGETGGRALLRRAHGQWAIVLCTGDQIRDPATLRHAGVPERDAQAILVALAAAEKSVSKERLAQLARFDGVMMMQAGEAHPTGHNHAAPAPAAN